MRRIALALVALASSLAASHRTENFIVEAATPALAQRVAETAEVCRRELAMAWLEEELPKWSRPCPIRVVAAPQLAAGGATEFYFDRGEVYGWNMRVQGSEERILDSVLPHEITHTIFASHFRQPLPRWADEGACSTIEHAAEQAKLQQALVQFLMTGRGLAFNQMFAMGEYPQDVLPLYAQGRSVALYLIGQGGRKKFVDFLAEGLSDDWQTAVETHYGVRSLGDLQEQWLAWVRQGSPAGAPLQVGRIVDGPVVAFTGHQAGCPCGRCRAAATLNSTPTPDPEPPTAEDADRRPKPQTTYAQPAANYVTKEEFSRGQAEQDAGIAKKIDEIGKKLDALRSDGQKADAEIGGLVGKLTDQVVAGDSSLAAKNQELDQRLQGRVGELGEKIGGLATIEQARRAAIEAAEAIAKNSAAATASSSATAAATWLGLPITGLVLASLGIGGLPAIAVVGVGWWLSRKLKQQQTTSGGGEGGAASRPFGVAGGRSSSPP